MTKIEVKSLNNAKVKDINISDSIWMTEANADAMKKMIRLQLAATRQGTHKTKTRSEVAGGGRKPWKQKGTGRARQGSIRSPQWRGGGISGGVQPRDYTFKINKKERVLAIKSALSDKIAQNAVVVFETLSLENSKTKEFKLFLETNKLDGKVLFVTMSDDANLYLASRNLGYVYVIPANEINVYDVVNADTVVFDEAAINYIEEVLLDA